ncbi:MAG: arsenate reductase ArsC [Thermoanaerobaculia bacterium]
MKVLFLCTGNSARSILAEHLLRRLDPHRFETWSAGSRPRGEVHPLALEVLAEDYGVDASAARSKSWRELADVDFDLVVTVCDDARESCPVWPGRTAAAQVHWGLRDPGAVTGDLDRQLAAFRETAHRLDARLARLAALPLEELDQRELQQRVERLAE